MVFFVAMKKKFLSLIIPVLNEAGSVTELTRRIDETLKKSGINYEIIFVDDHSRDSTIRILKKLSEKYPIRIHVKEGKPGKGFSILEGISLARGDNLGFIDGDLQYSPEALGEMFATLETNEVVVGERVQNNTSFLRKYGSKANHFIFSKFLLGLDYDTQSGLKLFKKKILKHMDLSSVGPWTFDLPLLYTAAELNYKIESVGINFKKRQKGVSKLNFIKASLAIAKASLGLRLAGRKVYSLKEGIIYKKKKFITHTTLPIHQSAIFTFKRWQKAFILASVFAVLIGILLNLITTIIIFVAILSFIYFLDVFFNLYLILKSLYNPPEININSKKLENLNQNDLPIYSILCPLYKEAVMIPQFLSSMEKLDWPKEKLEVLLLLEEDDKSTIEKVQSMSLPYYVRTVVVPYSQPKTKPKACNYGLRLAKGKYVVVYDAEDAPDPLQLKKAYLAFKKLPRKVFCLQAKLNYYNPHHNLLTKLFTAEYSLWFDVVLPGLQEIETSIPLGGTSNHFRTSDLRKLHGWDPFNVTEDCDLGIRLFKQGYKTAIIDSTTLEEANSNIFNWLRQRSRWLKGYLQTYFVHMRNPKEFVGKSGIHALIFQLLIGGKIAFMLINPLLWVATVSYFLFYAYVGPAIESVYPTVVFYMAATSLVLGNFIAMYNYMIGCARRGHWGVIKYVFLIPFYWLLISVGAAIASYQLIFKPHYWEKTIHGFHLNKKDKKAIIAEAIIESEETNAGFVFPSYFRKGWASLIANKTAYLSGFLLVSALVVGNFLNFFFNAYLGRVLDFKDFALIGLIGGFLSVSSVIFGAFSATVNFKSGFLIGKYGEDAGYYFWHNVRKRIGILSFVLAIIWLVSTPFLMRYFHMDNPYPFLLFSCVLLIGFINGSNLGFLSTKLMFKSLAVVNLFEPVLKLAVAILLVFLGFKLWTFAAIPISIIGSFIIGWLLISRQAQPKGDITFEGEMTKFPFKFFSASIFSSFSSVAFLTVDILLANHFLAPTEAGKYALLSLVGKMVYFFGGLTSPFIIPLISRSEGANKNSLKTLYPILLGTFILALFGFVTFGLFGSVTIPLLYGKKALSIVPYLTIFTLGMMAYTVSKVFVNYYLVKKVYTFTAAGSLLVLIQVILIQNFHRDLGMIAMVMSFVWITHLLVTTTLHLGLRYVKIFESNLSDFFGLFVPQPKNDKNKFGILIFNWRDTKHKWAGGAEVYIRQLAKRWVKEGKNVTLFCGNGGKNPKNEIIDGIQIHRRGGFYTVYFWAIIYYIFKFRGKYDAIIDSENGIPFFTPLYAKGQKFLLIHHVHQEVFRKSLKAPMSWIAEFLELKLMPLVYRDIQIITVSPSSKEEIMRHKLTKIEPIVIYNGVDLKMFKPGKKNKNPLILYIGRLQYYKSLNVFIKAAKKVLESVPTAEFVIAGNGEEKKKLQKFADRLNISEKIKFLGKVSEEEKISLYQKAWVFVNPSFMEGWGITTIEANACGTCAVASNVAGLRDSIKNPHTGFLVKYADHEGFADSIIKLVKDKKLRKEMSEESVKWAKSFSWESSAKKLLKILTKTVNNKINTLNINKANLIETILVALVSIFRSNFAPKRLTIISNVGKYKLIKKLDKNKDFQNFFIGIYKLKGKKFFIKTWTGSIKDSNYYLLLNEYTSGKVLYQKLVKEQGNYKIIVPRIISHIKTKKSFSVIFEHIPGKPLIDYPVSYQVFVITSILDCLASLSKKLSKEERACFVKKSQYFYLLSLVPITMVTVLMNLRHARKIIKTSLKCAVNTPFVLGERLVLSHRDLNAENVLIYKSKIYVIDCERMALTIPGYDITHLSIIPGTKDIKKYITNRIGYKINSFLKNFLHLHYLMSVNYTEARKNFYLKSLD